MKKFTSCISKPREVTDEQDKKSKLCTTSVVPKSKGLVQGVKPKNTKSPINELLAKRKLTSLRNKVSTERKPTSLTNELPAERKPTSQPNKLSTERKPTNQTNELSAMRKTKSLTNELSAERTLTSLTNELSAGQKLTFVCISDTHCKLNKDDIGRIPHGDVLLHTGDFTMDGTERELIEFNNFLGALSHTYKVVIAGNHEFCLEDDGSWDRRYMRQHYREKYGVENIRDLLTNCIYLEDELTEICGIKIYGSPWTPMYSCCDAFSLSDREALQQKWDKIPTNVDILMTHGPPRGFGDTTTKGASAGCSNLLKTVQNRVKPKYHVFGHIHEGYGIYKDGKTTFINASICTRGYKPTNRPVKFRLYVPNSSVCDTDTANCSTKMGCESSRKGCDNSGCDTLEFVKCDNGCDTLEFVKHNNGCDTSEFVKPDNGCDTSEFVKCDNGCDSELTKTNARSFPGNTKPEQFKEKLRDCASNWNWAENDGTELNYTKLTYCEMHTGI